MTTNNNNIINELLQEFSKLNTNDEDIIDESCRAIRTLFEKAKRNGLPTLLLGDQLLPFIQLGLQHPSTDVQTLTLRQINDTLSVHRQQTIEWLKQNNLLQTFIPLLMKSTSVAQAVNNILNELSKPFIQQQQQKQQQPIDTTTLTITKELLLSSSFIDSINFHFNEVVKNDDSASVQLPLMRLEEAVLGYIPAVDPVALVDKLPKLLAYAVEHSMEDSDLLLRLSLMEMVGRVGKNVTVFQWIVKNSKFVDILVKTLLSATNNQSGSGSDTDNNADPLFINGVLQMLSNWLSADSEHIQILLVNNNELQSALFGFLGYCVDNYRQSAGHSDIGARCVERAIETLGSIGTQDIGLQLLTSTARPIVNGFIQLSIKSLDQVNIPSRHALSLWLQHQSKDNTERSNLLHSSIGSESLLALTHSLNQSLTSPIVEVKTAALHLIQSLCFHEWGAKSVISQPGFFEYLISRTVENTKLMREWKFTIVQTLVTRQSALLNTPNTKSQWKQLEDYHRLGIHYIPAEANVSVATQEM